MGFINEEAFDVRIESIARKVFLEEHVKDSQISKKELKEELRLLVQQQAFNREQAAKYIGKSPSTIDRLVKAGKLKTTVNGTLKYFRKQDLDEWINSGITTREV